MCGSLKCSTRFRGYKLGDGFGLSVRMDSCSFDTSAVLSAGFAQDRFRRNDKTNYDQRIYRESEQAY